MDKNYIELYSKDGKEGVNIKGQDVVLLDAPEVRLSPDTPLLTNAQDLAGAINELFQSEPGGGDIGTLKAIVDDGAANLSVILTDGSALAEYPYTYIAKLITASVTTSATSGDTTTTSTKSWSKYLIDKLYDVSGSLVAQAVYSDEAKGIVSHYLDGSGGIIYIDGGYIAEGLETGAAVSGADVNAVAIAYAIARNQESSSALQEMKKAYREGAVDGDNGNGDVTEPYETTDPDEDISIDDGNGSTTVSDPAITDLTKGFWYAFGDPDTGEVTDYIRVWVEAFYYEVGDEYGNRYIYKNRIWVGHYQNGVLVEQAKLGQNIGSWGNICYSKFIMGGKPTIKYVTKVNIERFSNYVDVISWENEKRYDINGILISDDDYTGGGWRFYINGDYMYTTNVQPSDITI